MEARCLKYKEAGNKAERTGMTYDKGEPDLHGRDLKSSSSTDETIVRYLNDHPAINALQSSDVVTPTTLEEKSEESRADEYTKTSSSSIIQNELKELQLVESSASSASTSSAHRLDILKQHQHDGKLEKLKERIRKQWECSDELTVRGHHPEHSDHPITVTAPENIVTPKIRKVATAPMAPSYKGTQFVNKTYMWEKKSRSCVIKAKISSVPFLGSITNPLIIECVYIETSQLLPCSRSLKTK